MFKRSSVKYVANDYMITEDRWLEVLHHIQETCFWDKKLHGKEIENIMEALRNHKFENNTDLFQMKEI